MTDEHSGAPVALDLYRLLVESVRDYAMFVLDVNGNVASWNTGAREIKGYEPDEIIGMHFSIFYPIEKIEERFPWRELEVAAIEGRFEDEGWRLRKNGDRFWANVVITALRDETGALLGFAKVTRDLTERRQAEQRAIADAQRVAAAEAANRAKGEFLASMSHELRTPLNAIGGYAELLALGVRGPITDEMSRDLDRIRRSQQHLLSIINDLLNFSRIEAGHVHYDIERVHLDACARAAAALVEPQAWAKQLTLDVESIPLVEALADRA